MVIIEYTGQLTSGSAISGTLEAVDIEDAKSQLESMGIRVTTVAAGPQMRPSRPLSREDVLFFNQQLASLAQTGIALDEGLRILAKDLQRGRLRRVVSELADDIERGIPIEDAIKQREGMFPPLYSEVLRSGIKNNQLGSTLCNMNTHMSLMQTTRRLVWESATYPLTVLVVGLLVLTLFMTVVVPEYQCLIADVAELEFWSVNSWSSESIGIPLTTQILFSLSANWTTILLTGSILAIGSLLAFGILRSFRSGRRLRETLIMLTPGLAGVHLASLLARFSQAAALSATAGHDLPTLLRLAAGATGHHGLIRDADELSKRIESGQPAAEASKRAGIIPAIFGYTACIAGQRGQLFSALGEMARSYDALARHRIVMLRLLLTPFLIMLAACMIGLGILGLFLPLMKLVNSITT